MPIFEYRCRACDHRFEVIVNRSTKPLCPACESAELDKQLSVFAVGPAASATPAPEGACGRCGDPRGPGICSFN